MRLRRILKLRVMRTMRLRRILKLRVMRTIRLRRILTLSSKPAMPIPETAAVPARPMKWPELWRDRSREEVQWLHDLIGQAPTQYWRRRD